MASSSVPRGQRYFVVPVGPPPSVITPGKPIDWCRCGSAILLPSFIREYRVRTPDEVAQMAAIEEWWKFHSRPAGHMAFRDFYRAECRSHIGGCRNCGAIPAGRKQFYCSDECRTAFDLDHFWGTARHNAIESSRLEDDLFRMPRCARGCGRFSTEVNHIVPLNGDRPHFGCCHHRDNLEALCHYCHLETTAEQRRLGQIGSRVTL